METNQLNSITSKASPTGCWAAGAVDILWVVLAERATTNGAFSLMWQLCPKGSGPGSHYYDQDEGFYVTEGQITYVAGDEQLVAKLRRDDARPKAGRLVGGHLYAQGGHDVDIR